MSFIVNWVSDKVEGYAKTGIQAGGTLAGNAVGGVGGLVEGAGRSAANGVTGSIGGVANYINGYGNKIQRSMSSDGPVSTPVKKTAVKPNAPTSAPKALPSTQGAKKALPAASKARTAATKRPPTSTASTKKPGALPTTKPLSSASKPASSNLNKITSTSNSSGKVVISPASRPKASAKTTTRPVNGPKPAANALGIGENYGSLKSGGGGAKSGTNAMNQRKSSAADPLAIGKDFGQFGKK